MRVGFVHTASAHRAICDLAMAAAFGSQSPDVTVVHRVLPELLNSPTNVAVEAVWSDVGRLCDAVVVTCTSIGAAIEHMFSTRGGPPVVRVDRELVRAATRVAHGQRRLVLVTSVETAKASTLGLLQDEAPSPVPLKLLPVPGAWTAFERGDAAAVESALVAALVGQVEPDDVVLLGQLSLAAAADRVRLALQQAAGPGVSVLAGVDPAIAALPRPGSARAGARE